MLRKNTFFLILFLIFFASTIQSQNAVNSTIDSLKTELKKAEDDTQKAEIYTKLSSYLEYLGTDNTIKYCNQALIYSQKINNDVQTGTAYANLGTAYQTKLDYAQALKNLHKALETIKKTDDKTTLIRVYNNIGLIYIDLKKHKQGINYYNKAIKLAHETNNERLISLLFNNIGDINLQKKEYKKALNYFYRALIINKKLEYTRGIGINLTNIGICYINIKNYEKGIEMLNKSIVSYDNTSNLYNSYNKYELGKAYYLMSQDERYINEKENYIDKSISVLDTVLTEFKKYNSLKDIQETNLYLSKGNKAKGNFELALDYFEKYSNVKDSVFSKESEKKFANLEFQRQIDLRDQQIEIQTLKINSDARKVYLLVTISIAVAVLLGLFLFLYISKRRNNELLKEKNSIITNINFQKDKFYAIIAHDLRGPFNGFLGLTELLAEDINDMSNDEIKFASTNMRSSAKNLLALLENLLEWTRMEQNTVPFDPDDHPLRDTVLNSIITLHDIAAKKEIKIDTQIPSDQTVFADKNMFQGIIRNIVLNALKFTPKQGSVLIKTKESNAHLIISVQDSGIGMPQSLINDLFKLDAKISRIGTDNEPSTGLGLILCKEFIEKHNGKIWVESEEGKGSTFFIRFRKNKKLIV